MEQAQEARNEKTKEREGTAKERAAAQPTGTAKKRAAGRARKPDAGAKKPDAGEKKRSKGGDGVGPRGNRVRDARVERMLSKAELARRANLSVLTIDRVEKGLGCRMDTKRKILEALGMRLSDRTLVFGEEE